MKIFLRLKTALEIFFLHRPALLQALFFLLGLILAKEAISYFILLLPLLMVSLKKPQRTLLPSLLVTALAYLYGLLYQESFPPPLQKVAGSAYFTPLQIQQGATSFQKAYKVQGVVVHMQTKEGTIARQIPCFMTLSSFPPLTGSYQIEGVLEKKEGYFLFSPEPDLAWVPIKRSISLVHLRWKASSFMRDQLHRLFEDPSLAHFFTALTLGTNEDRMLRFHFGKLGLQHILAISGFHFGLIALLIGGFLKVFCKKDSLCLPLLFVILTGYFLFLGSSPSILRAYIAISLYLLARWKGWPTDGLNLLGAALLLELLIAPKSLTHLGFQLSFLSTFAILLFTPITLKWTEKLFPKRSSIQLWIERPIYLFCCLLRSTLALNLAVMLFVVPVCLFYFHKFPLSSLLYNLFIPLATSMSLYLFFLSLPFFWLFPPLGSFLHGINTAWTGTLLSLVFESPSWLDVSLRISWISLPLLLLVMVSLSVYGIDRRAQKGLHP